MSKKEPFAVQCDFGITQDPSAFSFLKTHFSLS